MQLKIVSPEKVVYAGEAHSLVVPGSEGEFEILANHAPIISSLEHGKMVYVNKDGRQEIEIQGGFVEVHKNCVNVCVETA